MNNLVMVNNGQVIVSSRQIADNFGKRHNHVLRDIETLIEGMSTTGHTELLFYKSTYINEQNNQEYPEYVMNRDGFVLLSMGFKGASALEWKLKYIAAFNAMEATLAKPVELTRIEILELALAAEKKVLELEATIEEQKPAVEFTEAVHVSDSVRSIGELAKIICQNGIPMGQNRLFALLREAGYLGKRESVDYNMPTQKAMNLELFMIKQTAVNRTAGVKIESTPRVTGKGLVYFVNKFVKAKQIADAIALEELGQIQLAEMQAAENAEVALAVH